MIQVLDQESQRLMQSSIQIQSPITVIKELLDNAVDSGATLISLSLMQCGIQEIQVQDNGKGIRLEVLKLIGQKRASTKIDDQQQQCGFRGEALYVLQTISEVTLQTQYNTECYELNLNTGQIKDCLCDQGTKIICKNLFHNLPVRKLHYTQTLAQINKQLNKFLFHYSLCYTNIGFLIQNNKQLVLNTQMIEDKERCLTNLYDNIFGVQNPNAMIQFEVQNIHFKLNCYISAQNYGISNQTQNDKLFIIINGRPIINDQIQKSIKQTFKLISSSSQPIGVINITCSKGAVDFNVSADKIEVQIMQLNNLLQFIETSYKQQLSDQNNKQINQVQPKNNINQRDKIIVQSNNTTSKFQNQIRLFNTNPSCNTHQSIDNQQLGKSNATQQKKFTFSVNQLISQSLQKNNENTEDSDTLFSKQTRQNITETQNNTNQLQQIQIIDNIDDQSDNNGYNNENYIDISQVVKLQNNQLNQIDLSFLEDIKYQNFEQPQVQLINFIQEYNQIYDQIQSQQLQAQRYPNQSQLQLLSSQSLCNSQSINIFGRLRVINQYNKSFIITEDKQNKQSYIIDQHSLEEATRFEKMQSQMLNNCMQSSQETTKMISYQKLISKQQFSLSIEQRLLIEQLYQQQQNSGKYLLGQQYGFKIIFDEQLNQYFITQVGYIDSKLLTQQDLLSIIDCQQSDTNPKLCEKIKKIISNRACKSSVRLGESMSQEEMSKLLVLAEKCNDCYNCPHGRPSIQKVFE